MSMIKINARAREAALAARDAHVGKPTSLVSYQSTGLVVVVASPEQWQALPALPQPLRAIGLLDVTPTQLAGITVVGSAVARGGRDIELIGHLGAFELLLSDRDGTQEVLRADIVLDLGEQALNSHELPPVGYLRADPVKHDLNELVVELSEMTGEFEKPRYFNYNADICAHGVNGGSVCTRCIDACPAGAIHSGGAHIEVDPFLCQGGGVCATVCPSGAIQYAYPRLTDQGNRLRVMLKAHAEQGGQLPILLLHADSVDVSAYFERQPNLLPVAVEEIASVGMDLCLSALVYGAAQLYLLVDDDAPPSAARQLAQQLEWGHAVMHGLGLAPERLQLLQLGEFLQPIPDGVGIEPALYSMPDNKRQALLQAVDHLYQHAPRKREMVDLPAGAPFGTAVIDEKACTLCMACVGACPGKALQDGSNRETPEIFFIESNCLQCGACTLTCPETAISISPRLVFDREKRNQSRMLNQDTPFACISCGKPFAPTSVIHKMSFKLKGHHMFQTARALDRLKMCENCRVADIVQDAEAMDGHFDPLEPIARDFTRQ